MALFGSESAARVLLVVADSDSVYCSQIAKKFGCTSNMIQLQLDKFESAGLLVSHCVGRTRLYTWNPRNAAVAPIRALLETLAGRLSPDERDKYLRPERKRPRRRGKPLVL